MTNSREDILTYKGQTGFHIVTWVVLHILPYTSAGEPLVGFADRLDGTRWVGLTSVTPNQFQYTAQTVDIKWNMDTQTPELANYDCFPLYICGIPGWGHHDTGSGLTCHPEAIRRMVQAREPNKVKFIRTRDLRIIHSRKFEAGSCTGT